MLCWFLPYNSVNQPYITFSRIWFSVTPWTAACQASLSITNSGACSNSCLSSQWCHPTISSSVIPFSSCLQSFPASGFFPMSQFSVSGSQSTGVSASTSVLPMNIQDWFPLGWTGLIFLQPQGLSRIFSNTTDCSLPSSSVHGILQARIMEWVAVPFSRRSSQPRDRSQVSCIAGGFFTIWTTRKAPY